MTNSRGFNPVGTEIKSTQTLYLPFHAQADFITDLRETANLLESDPFSLPSLHAAKIGGIALDSGTLSISYSEARDTYQPHPVSKAEIILGLKDNETQLQSTPDNKGWEVWDNASRGSYIKNLDSSSVIGKLAVHLKRPEDISSLLDAPNLTPFETAQLLRQFLEKRATYGRMTEQYSVTQPLMQALEIDHDTFEPYLSSVRSELTITQKNRKTSYDFVTSAPVDIGGNIVEKEYRYSSEQKAGWVTLKSLGAVSSNLLSLYAKGDAQSSNGLVTLQSNLAVLRNQARNTAKAA